jgi:hypothetical protein
MIPIFRRNSKLNCLKLIIPRFKEDRSEKAYFSLIFKINGLLFAFYLCAFSGSPEQPVGPAS